MKPFLHINAKNLKETEAALKSGKTNMIAGGTELLNILKDTILPGYPETVINLKTIPELDYIKEEKKTLRIGALTRLSDIAENKIINEKYTALAQAALSVATPHVRDMGTIGGNLTQLPRCWYFRKPQNRFNCIRKGGNECFAMTGENRYHSAFGADTGCIAPNPVDIAPALIALDAAIVTTKRRIGIEDLWEVGIPYNTVLKPEEIITEVQIPVLPPKAKSAYIKFAQRKSIDFAIVNCAVLLNNGTARISLNAVAPKPLRAKKAEQVVKGKSINEALAGKAGEAAVEDAKPFPDTKYKVQIAKTLVKRALLAAAKA